MGCENIKLSKAPRRRTTTDVFSQACLGLRCWASTLHEIQRKERQVQHLQEHVGKRESGNVIIKLSVVLLKVIQDMFGTADVAKLKSSGFTSELSF
eukprot:3127775-Rhodomonas_salina.1